ncbi:MAG: WG repeat-containing protein [Bacillota bacterium]
MDSAGKWGYIDTAGNMVVGPQFEEAFPFKEGLARVGFNDGKKGFIDKEGQIVIEPKYDFATDFFDGYAAVHIYSNEKSKYFVINKEGKVVIETPYEIYGFAEGLAIVKNDVHCFGYMDTPAIW